MSPKRADVTGLSFEGRGERIAKGLYIPVLRNLLRKSGKGDDRNISDTRFEPQLTLKGKR